MSHALLNPSSSKQWMTCTPSARFGEQFPESESEFASEGSFAHLLALHILSFRLGFIPLEVFDRGMEDFEKSEFFSPEMLNHINTFASWVLDQLEPGDSVFLEQRLGMTEWIPEGYGTGDVIILNDDYIHVVDLKYGKGIPVKAQDNTQLKCYAVGAAQTYRMLYDFEAVIATIYQPRLEDGITEAKYSLVELMNWADNELKPLALMAWNGEGQFVPGDHCQFCKGKAHCEARMKAVAGEAFMLDEPDDLVVLKPNTLSEQDMERWVSYADPLIKWLGDLKKYAMKTALEGKQWPGLKLVEGRSNRVYSDREAVRKALDGTEYTGYMKPATLLGVGALEKLLDKMGFHTYVEPYIIKPTGKPTLVKESDKRPSLDPQQAALSAFADDEDEEED